MSGRQEVAARESRTARLGGREIDSQGGGLERR